MKKVLCLHGYAMSGDWLREWLAPIEASLGESVEFIYPDAPIECSEAQVREIWASVGGVPPAARVGKGKNWCWYRASDDVPRVYRGVAEALIVLAKLFEKEGPIDGVIGWSQGTFLASLLIGEMLSQPQPRFKFNWAVLGAGGISADPQYSHYFDKQFSLPSLHVVGRQESDFIKQRSQALFEQFENAERLEPPVGHVLPLKHPDYMQQIADWIRFQLNRDQNKKAANLHSQPLL